MKHPILLCVASLVALPAVALFVSSCDAAGARQAAADLQSFSTLLSATIADGTVTPEEGEALKVSFQKMGASLVVAMEPRGFDWSQVVYVAISALLGGSGAIAAASRLPNAILIGKQEALALDKAAGISR